MTLPLPDTLIPALARRIAELLSRAPAGARLLSLSLPLPVMPPFALPPDGIYWARPRQGRLRLGVGTAVSATAAGPDRLAALARAFEGYRAGWRHLKPEGLPFAPAAFVGFAFHPEQRPEGFWQGFPNALLRVPELLIERRGRRCAVTFTSAWPRAEAELVEQWCARLEAVLRALHAPPRPAGCPLPIERMAHHPEDHQWLARAHHARAAIHAATLHKAVLTRQVRVSAPRKLELPRLLAALAYRHPEATQLAVASPHTTLLSASPERLVSLRGALVESDALAGTTARAPTPEADRRLGEALLADPKSRREHALVVEHLAAALAPLCRELHVPETPELLPLRALQHLRTPVRGWLRDGSGLLTLAGRLHPTPAVGGAPSAEANAWLTAAGEAERGWYTGAAGWLEANGNGELNVILRCALVEGAEAHLFAGAGFVAGSDPAQELAETELKLGPMLEVLADG